jgi:hypothetical protein
LKSDFVLMHYTPFRWAAQFTDAARQNGAKRRPKDDFGTARKMVSHGLSLVVKSCDNSTCYGTRGGANLTVR